MRNMREFDYVKLKSKLWDGEIHTIHESHDYIPVRPSYVLQMHRDLLQYAQESFGGQFKNTQNYISETRSDGSQFVRFTPMAPYETPNAVEAICESYQKALDMQAVDPLILIPIFILFQQEDSDLLGRG